MPKTAIDPYSGVSPSDVNAPTRRSQVVTPSDSTDLQYVTKQLLINVTTGGNVTWIDPDQLDANTTTVGFAVGTYILNVQVRRIMSTGTTIVGSIVALWG